MPTVSDNTVKTKLTEVEYTSLPRFTIRASGCCGLMEVSGIQRYMDGTFEDIHRKIVLGLYTSLKFQHEEYIRLVNNFQKALERYQQSRTSANEWNYLNHQHGRNYYAGMFKTGFAGQFIFTYIQEYGEKFFEAFSEYVRKNSLGEVYISPNPFYNPNSAHHVRTVLFSIDNKGYLSFIHKHLTDEQAKF